MSHTHTSKDPFGYQLLLDLYDCDPVKVKSITECYWYLDNLPEAIHMNKQSPPFIFYSDNRLYPDKAGLSGWVPLIESGIQLHTLESKNFVTIDIYSCGNFSKDAVITFTKEFFKPKKIEQNYLLRGVEYYKA